MGAAADRVPERRRGTPPSPWLFGIFSAPYGCFNGLVAVALPYVLRNHGFAVERIAAIGAAVQAPAIWYFLWAPIVDIRLRRRTWLILLSVVSAACAAVAIGNSRSRSLHVLTVLLVTASVFNQPVSSAVGGLAAEVVPNQTRGRTGGWSQAGILGGGVIAGGLTVWLTDHAPALTTSLIVAALIIIPAFAVLGVDEPPPHRVPLRDHLSTMFREVAVTLRRRDVWLAFLFFLSPIGAGALMNLFSAIAGDFHASETMVIAVVAVAGILMPVGALIGGVLCDRYDRWRMYPLAGLTEAASAGAMVLAPFSPASYLIGAAAYAFTSGLCYAAFMSLAFELVGSTTEASSTRFTLFMAAVNVPVVYMLRLDGWGHAHFGVRGLLAVDAICNGVLALVLLASIGALKPLIRRATRRSIKQATDTVIGESD